MQRLGPAGIAFLMAVAGCTADAFLCARDEQCAQAGRAGACIDGACAFEDAHCASGWVFAELAPPELAGRCVEVDVAETSTGGNVVPDPTSGDGLEAVSSGTADMSGASESTTGGCPPGSPCDPDDPCALEGACDEDGACVPTAMVACEDPPGPCHEPVGTCNALGHCEYAALEAGLPCDAGDPCTSGDTCDDRGACVAGESCATDNPCKVGHCTDEGCVYDPMPNGTSCGEAPAARCCNGACVDISSDVAHCGGCNTACAPGLSCESVAVTSSCESSPAATSGRCRCQTSNAQCPNGQICRTFTPFPDRCTPPDADACDGTLVYLATCPNYCSY